MLKPTKSRQKLDPRLAVLLSLGARPLAALKTQEAAQLSEVAKLLREAQAALDAEGDAQMAKSAEAMQRAEQRLFAPITTGVHYPPARGQGKPWPVKLDQPYAAVFILSDGSAADLARLGVKVRSQAGDVFTGFVPLASMAKLEQSAAVRYIELARPVFPTLNQAVPYAQINTLHGAAPPITGAGVIVGISDSVLDVYHPDFRMAANTSRVLFLWDQTLTPIAGESGPPTAPALPGFAPAGGAPYGVEYNQATINKELAAYAPPGTPAYGIVRHGGTTGEHGTHVAGIAAGNGRGQAGTFTGAAPGADIIFVANPGLQNTNVLADLAFVADAFSYIFARAAARGQPCVVNLSNSDNQGPHDGSTLGEQFLDNLLLTPGRAITVSAGNSNNTACHAAGNVAAGGTTNLVLNYAAGIHRSDAVEIWYDGHDRFNITLTIPTAPATVIGPVAPGAAAGAVLPNGVQVQVTSVQGDPRNGDNLISVIMTVPAGQNLPTGNWTFALAGTTVINGGFHAWVDRNNRGLSAWQAPLR